MACELRTKRTCSPPVGFSNVNIGMYVRGYIYPELNLVYPSHGVTTYLPPGQDTSSTFITLTGLRIASSESEICLLVRSFTQKLNAETSYLLNGNFMPLAPCNCDPRVKVIDFGCA